jgi:DNA-binding NarL/FixJ family response regulator
VPRIAVVDDHPVARRGLHSMLSALPSVEVVAAVAAPVQLPRTADGHVDADVVLMDLYLDGERPALGAIETIATHRPVLVVSASREPADVLAAMQSGASGYLTKHADDEDYAEAIAALGEGKFHLSAHLADVVHMATGRGVESRSEVLSPREREALAYVARGFTHQQTATRMGVSTATVNTYISRIRAKLGLGNKAELALAALRHLPQR